MSRNRKPTLAGFLFRHSLLGFGVGLVLGVALIAANVAGLRGLVFDSNGGWIGGVILAVSMGFTFGGFQCGSAVMRLGEVEDSEPQGGLRIPAGLVPARIRARRQD